MKTHRPSIFFALFVVVALFASAMLVAAAMVAPTVATAVALFATAGITVNRANLDDAFRGFQTLFNNAFTTAPSQWQQIAMQVPSSGSEEKYAWLGMMPGFREWVGERVINRLKLHDYTVKNKPFELTVEVKRDDIEDDKIGVYSPLFTGLGEAATRHPNELVFALLKAGFASPCYDGQYFFDTDHPVEQADGSITTQSNFGGGTGAAWYLLETKRSIKPIIFQKRRNYTLVRQDKEGDDNVFNRASFVYGSDARVGAGYGLWQQAYASKSALDVDSYAAARAQIMSLKGDKGAPLAIMPDTLLVPPSLEKAAKYAVSVERLANGQDNPYKDTATVIVCPWLA